MLWYKPQGKPVHRGSWAWAVRGGRERGDERWHGHGGGRRAPRALGGLGGGRGPPSGWEAEAAVV